MSQRIGIMIGLMTMLSAWIGVSAKEQTVPSLKDALSSHFLIGVALGGTLPESYSATEQALITDNFTQITPENCMKPEPIEPREGVFNFTAADALVAFAQAHGMRVTGHTLVWQSQCPQWFFVDGNQPASREHILQRMKAHIQAEVGRYKGKILGWDVVNEAIADNNGYLHATPWSQLVGEDFIDKAFEYAHEADPNAELYYNDYGIEQPQKRAKTLKLIAHLKAQGLRIDAVGIQGHWEVSDLPLRDIEDSILAFHQAGVKVMITELDLDMVKRHFGGADVAHQETATADPLAAGCPPELLAQQAERYADLFRLLLKHDDSVTRVTFWGLHDGRSWLNAWPSKRTNYPLLFDRHCQPKPAYAAVLAAAASVKHAP